MRSNNYVDNFDTLDQSSRESWSYFCVKLLNKFYKLLLLKCNYASAHVLWILNVEQ